MCNGNSFHAKGGRGSKRSQLKYCLRLIRSIVSLENEDAIQDLSDQGAIGVLLKILEKYSRTIDKYDQIDVDILSDILFILTCICESDLHRKVSTFSLVACPYRRINVHINNEKQK